MKAYMECLEKLVGRHGIEQIDGQFNIKGFMKITKARYKSSKIVLDEIYNLHNILQDFNISNILLIPKVITNIII